MSTIFDLPCPECGHSLSVGQGARLECPSCQRTYQSQMGHLFRIDEPTSSAIPAPATWPAARTRS